MPNYLSSLFGSPVCFAGDNCNDFFKISVELLTDERLVNLTRQLEVTYLYLWTEHI